MRRKLLVPGALAAVVAAAAACDRTPAGIAADGGLTRAEAEALAPEYDRVAGAVLSGVGVPSLSVSGEGAPAAAATRSITFTHTRDCPRGGTSVVAGTHDATFDSQVRSATFQTAATRTDAACAFQGRNGGVLTVTGNPNLALTAAWSITNGTPGKRTMTQKGGFSWSRSTGRSGTCTVDLVSTWDPATRTHTVKGTFCGHTVDVTRTRAQNDG